MHTCGATFWMMEDLIEMGVDIVHPLQANAKGNEDAERLKREYGDRLVFHGNTNNQGVFHRSKEEVMADALYRIRHLAPGGGYIFSGGHNIQANMQPESIMALFNTAKEYGKYPIDIARIDKKLSELSEINPVIKEEIKI
jgi:uroporphyrinogen decarboxylase